MEKLVVDREILVQILQEENRTHDAAIKELEDKIANYDQQIKSASAIETNPSQTSSQPVQETPDEIDALQERARELLQESERIQSEDPPEEPKKKKRELF